MSETGSLSIESLSVRWKIIKRGGFYCESPLFNFRNIGCYFTCTEDEKENIYLCLLSLEPPSLPLTVTVRVEEGSNGKVVQELTRKTTIFYSEDYHIWFGARSEVERLSPDFKSNNQLRFHVIFDEANSVTDGNSYLCLENLAEDFEKLLDVNSSPDVELHCEGHITKAHKNILCARSPVLASMLQSDMIEGRTGVVKIQDMTYSTFQQFFRYIYTGQLDTLTFDSAMRLYEAGDMYEVKRLANRCSRFLVYNLTVENACDVIAVADAHSDAGFVEEVILFMLGNEVPMSGDRWRDFCKTHSELAIKVYGRFCEMLYND